MSSRPRARGRGGFRGSYRGRGGGEDWGSSSRGRGRGRGSYDKFDSYRGGRSDDNYRGGGRRGSDGYRGRGTDGYRGRGSEGYRGRGSDNYRGRTEGYRGRSENYRGRSENYRGRSEQYGGSSEHYSGRSEGYRSKRGSSSRHYDDSPPRRREGSYRRSSPNPEKLIASLGPDAEEALTAIISKVMKKTSNRDSRGREDREGSHRYKEVKERRESFYREDSRERHHRDDDDEDYHRGSSRSYPSKYQSSGGSAPPPKRRTSLHGEQPYKRQRVDKDEEDEGTPRGHESSTREDSPSKEGSIIRDVGKGRDGSRSPGHEKSLERDGEGGSGDEGGMQVTIKSDGERAVNNEGHGRGGRIPQRLFVELKCPHCPGQRSITFKEYKYHLTSESHKNMLSRVARKHSVVLRKIRVQQRQEQKDIEAQWRDETPEEFKSAVTRFCSTCKLAFKCMGAHNEDRSEGIALHNRSKLHRMQRHYLHPRCGICRMTFQSRMLYEYHISSISHMRARTTSTDKDGERDPDDVEREGEEEDDDLNLDNFMTLDSVGDDEESVGSEHDEITGGMETNEAADKAAHDDDDGDDEGDRRGGSSQRRRPKPEYWDKRSSRRDTNGSSGRHRRGRDADLDFEDEDEEDEEAPLEMDWSKEQQFQEEEEDNHENEPRGTKYVRRIDAYFCGLCYKIIRADRSSSGSRAVQRHCRSTQHINHYHELHPQQDKEKNDGRDGADEGENEEYIKKDNNKKDNNKKDNNKKDNNKKDKVEIKKESNDDQGKKPKDKHDVYDKHGEHYEDEEEHYDEEEYENEGVEEEEMEGEGEGEEEEEAAAVVEGHEEDQEKEHEEDQEGEHEEEQQEEQAEEMEDDVWEQVDKGLKQGSDSEVAENDTNKAGSAKKENTKDNKDNKDKQENKEQGEAKGEGEPMSSPEKKDEEWFEVGDDVNIE